MFRVSLMEVARNYDVHVLVVHHMKKRGEDDVLDSALGSQAIVGGSDTFIALKADNSGVRTLCTRQRYGKDMEPTQLTWNEESRELSLGQTCDEAERLSAGKTSYRIEKDMLSSLWCKSGVVRRKV